MTIGLMGWLAGISVIPNPPVGNGLVLRPFDPPKSQYSAAHRGVDLQAYPDQLVSTPISGVVHFSGYVVDRPVITIATATILMSFEPVDSFLSRGEQVSKGDVIGWVGSGGHCDQFCIHIGVRRIGSRVYFDPIPYLLQLPRLLPAKP